MKVPLNEICNIIVLRIFHIQAWSDIEKSTRVVWDQKPVQSLNNPSMKNSL
jgi:hypothetical protein